MNNKIVLSRRGVLASGLAMRAAVYALEGIRTEDQLGKLTKVLNIRR
jgi:hypothetical protein